MAVDGGILGPLFTWDTLTIPVVTPEFDIVNFAIKRYVKNCLKINFSDNYCTK